MFEPIHGSAFDITGMGIGRKNIQINSVNPITDKGLANPVATFWTACEMLSWLGEKEAADNLLNIVEGVCEKGIMTKDLGGSATTVEVTDAVCEAIETKLGKVRPDES